MELQLEVVPVPVDDVDRAKQFYVDKLGFNVDHDVQPSEGVRVVQLTPPGSACSIVLATGLPPLEMEPGSIRGLHLVVSNIAAAHAALLSRGLELGQVEDIGGMLYAGFSDPAGNTWTLQEIPANASQDPGQIG